MLIFCVLRVEAQKYKTIDNSIIWAHSSVGQSARLIIVRSMVQIHLGPP